MSEMVELDDEREVEWIKKEEIEVEEQYPVTSGVASHRSSHLTKQKEAQWHVPYPAATANDVPEEEERQQVAAIDDSTMTISNVQTVVPLPQRSLDPPTARSQRRIQQGVAVVRVKTEPLAEADRDEGSSASASFQEPAPSKRPRRGALRAELVEVKMKPVEVKREPVEPDETAPSGTSSGSGELGAIRQLLSTLQKPVDDDQVFGEHIACELRSIRSITVKKRLKRTIMLAMINALEEDS